MIWSALAFAVVISLAMLIGPDWFRSLGPGQLLLALATTVLVILPPHWDPLIRAKERRLRQKGNAHDGADRPGPG